MTLVSGAPVWTNSAFAPRPKPVEADVGFVDALGPAFRTENIVGSSIVRAQSEPTHAERFASERVNPWDLIQGTEYEPYFDRFTQAETLADVNAVRSRIDRETADRRVLDQAGASGLAAQLVAGFVDLPTLAPGGVLVGSARRGAAVTAARTAAAAGAEAAAVEGVLQSQQETRTAFESATAIGGSVVLGALLGGVAGRMLARSPEGVETYKAASTALERAPDAFGSPEAAGAAVTMRPEITDFNLPTAAAQAVKDATPAGLSFTDRFAKSKSPLARQIGSELVSNEYAYGGVDRLGLQPAVEKFANVEYDRYQIAIAKTFRDDFKAHVKGGGSLSESEFAERVAMAMRRGDEDPEFPDVTKAARSARDSIVEPLKKEAIRLGKLPEDVKVETAASYFTRMWDGNRIVARSDEFLDRLSAKFAEDIKGDYTPDEIRAFAREAAEDVYDTLTNAASPSELLRIVVKARGPLKERTLNVMDVDFEDFLINDAEYVLNRYARVMSAENEMTRRFGSPDMEDQIKAIRDEYKGFRDAAKTEKERLALDREMKRVIRALEAARDQVRGTYKPREKASTPYRAMQGAMTYNFVRALGDVLRASLTDVFKLSMANGLMPVARDALVPLITNTKAIRASQKQLSEAAGIAEVLLNSRMMRIADISDPYAARTPVENFLQWMGSKASLFSGMNHWNQFLKEIALYSAHARFARMNLDNLSKRDGRYLQRLKLSKAAVAEIREQIDAHGVKVGSVFDPGLQHWNPDIRRRYMAALRADADTVIVTPGVGDRVPAIEEYWFAKPAMQFKAFALASHRKTLITGLQEDQARFVQNALLMVSMGMFVYWLKAQSAERYNVSDNPGVWLAEGIDRSGIVPIVMEMNNMAESVGAPGVYTSLGAAFGESPERASRYAVRNAAGAILGPSAGLVQDTRTLLRAGFTGEVAAGEVGAARRLIPFGNHPGMKEFLNLYAVPEIKEAVQ